MNTNPVMTNAEFHQAWNNLSVPHHAPEGYWDERDEERRHHRFVGRKAIVDGKVLECIRAEDDLVFFQVSPSSELIVSGDDVDKIKWKKV